MEQKERLETVQDARGIIETAQRMVDAAVKVPYLRISNLGKVYTLNRRKSRHCAHTHARRDE